MSEVLIENPNQPPEVSLPSSLEVGLETYCASQVSEWQPKVPGINVGNVMEEVTANYNLLEPVDEQKTDVKPSVMTICMPIALMGEDQKTIDRALDTIQASQSELGEPVDVILWTNAVAKENDGSKDPEIKQRYQELRVSLDRFKGSDIRINTALQTLPEEIFSISRIRSHYMEAVAVDAYKKGYGADHPILWLDADITYMSKDALADLNDKVRSGETLFAHAAERYTTEWANGTPLEDRDDATRAIIANEIHRRKFAKKLFESGERLGYPEESGLAFAIGTYLKLGGVNTQDPVNEASTLLSFGHELLEHGTVTRSGYPQRRLRTPINDPNLIQYVPSARIGISARRQYEFVKAHGTHGIRQAEGLLEYALFSNGKAESPQASQPITRYDMRRLLESRRNRYSYGKSAEDLDEKDRSIMDKLIERAFRD